MKISSIPVKMLKLNIFVLIALTPFVVGYPFSGKDDSVNPEMGPIDNSAAYVSYF